MLVPGYTIGTFLAYTCNIEMSIFHEGRVTIASFPPASTYSGHILMDDVMCSGYETRLVNCSFNPRPNCDHREDIGLACIPEDRRTLMQSEESIVELKSCRVVYRDCDYYL